MVARDGDVEDAEPELEEATVARDIVGYMRVELAPRGVRLARIRNYRA
jgi:hypothetical protein